MLVGGVAVLLAVIAAAGPAGAISSGTVDPTTLTASGQAMTFTFGGKDTAQNTTLVVTECIATDAKPGFDPTIDCSPLSQQSFSGVGASGTVNYGGNPTTNPYAPFVGTDANNGEWSVCTPNPGPGVTNYQSGFFRLADAPDDQVDDFFVPFTCGAAEVPEVSMPVFLTMGAALLVGGFVAVRTRGRGHTA